jgi:GNAT superfamily N-acetyltransferase
MNEIKLYNETHLPNHKERKEIVEFLFQHLENFGDRKEDIERAMLYAIKEINSFGGFIIKAFHNNIITAIVLVNKTGMSGYIPENILVYIATNKDYRGKGIGKMMMNKAIEIAEGNIALHVEPDNPAKSLYEKIGFTNKYLEMRYLKRR